MRVGELAKAAGVPASTVRYYERQGLIEAPPRTDGNYRSYGPEALERLRFIRSAQEIGFTLEDIRALARLRDGDDHLCDHVQELMARRLSQVESDLKRMRHVRGALKKYLERCGKRGGDHCDLIDELVNISADAVRNDL